MNEEKLGVTFISWSIAAMALITILCLSLYTYNQDTRTKAQIVKDRAINFKKY